MSGLPREHGGTGGQQPGVAGFGARKGLPDCGIHRVLAGDVHATGSGPGQDQRTVPLGGEPHAVHAAHLARTSPGARDRKEGTGWVSRSELLQQRGGGRLQPATDAACRRAASGR